MPGQVWHLVEDLLLPDHEHVLLRKPKYDLALDWFGWL